MLDTEPAPAPDSSSEDAVVARFVAAWESGDLDALVALLTDEVFMSMPPMPFEYEGRDAVARFCASIFGSGRRFDLVPTRANGQPAFGAYVRTPDGFEPRGGSLRPRPRRQSDLRSDPVRDQCVFMVRSAAFALERLTNTPTFTSQRIDWSTRFSARSSASVVRSGGLRQPA